MLPVLVSVATQTDDGGVDSTYFTLSVSSESSVSLSMSTLDLSSDESNDILASRRVMSSQTDLTLSDFDFGVCRESSDFGDDSDEGLDNSFNPYEMLAYQPIQESWYLNIRSLSDSSSPASSTDSGSSPGGKHSTGGPDAENQCQQFFDLLRNQCNAQSGLKHRKPDEMQCRQDKSDISVARSSNVICRSAAAIQNGGRIATRMVPKMGTKVEFTRPIISPSSGRVPIYPPPWHLPLKWETRCSQWPTTQNLRGQQPDPNHNPRLDARSTQNPDQNSNPLNPKSIRNLDQRSARIPDPGSNPFDPRLAQSNTVVHPTGFSHSDSERSNLASKFSPRNLLLLREWNSDGDSKNLSFPSSDDSTDQSPEPHDGPRGTDPEDKMDSLRRLYEQYADVMYTNEANLQHTIMVQQRLFEQQIANRSKAEDGKLCVKSTQPNHSVPRRQWAVHSPEQSAPLEWVIKRRADGTRYITRRPIVTKWRERVKQQPLEERRCVATTTDDDVESERKAGRYWTKEERRQHVEKARDQKRVKEGMVKPPVGVARETSPPNPIQIGEARKVKVRKEQIRVRSQDHAVTFQELLANGRVEAQGKTNSENPLLSVITI